MFSALRRFLEFDECRFDVAFELREQHAELVRVVGNPVWHPMG